jgi:trehalose synthase
MLLYLVRSPGQSVADLARVFPAALRLAAALYRDRTLPRSVRWRMRIALIYNFVPINIIPDFIPVIGLVDNVVVLAWALRSTVRIAGPDVVAGHWKGSQAALIALYGALRLPGLLRPELPPERCAAVPAASPNHYLRVMPGAASRPRMWVADGGGPIVSLVESVAVVSRPIAQLEPVIGPERHARLIQAASEFRDRLGERTVWNVSSTAVGGGVAEMLQVLLGYVEGLQIPSRWAVITGDAEFFVLTKRLHNQIHGQLAGGPLSEAEGAHYARMLAANAAELVAQVRPGDLVLLHDPQTAGLAAALTEAGARVAWRSHIGVDWENEATRAAWSFLRPHLAAARGFIFSRREYVPAWLPGENVAIIPPSIDPFSPKNQYLDDDTVRGILARIGVLDISASPGPTSFVRREGGPGSVTRSAEITGEGRPGADDPVVVQVSRWDQLKDMAAVMRGFADYVAPTGSGYLMLVGPAVAGVTDDPEGAAVFGDCLLQWHDLPAAVRDRVLLITLPLDDPDENAAMVNALQRHATVIVQKSLAEGFGLTVAEGMWKGRPVVGSAVGGIIDQIADGTGVLLPDPRDLPAFGTAVRQLLDDQGQADRMGRTAHSYISEHYVGDLHLRRYAHLFGAMISGN